MAIGTLTLIAPLGEATLEAVQVTILGSGSQGNATLVEAAGARVLLDAGLSARVIRERARAVRPAPLRRLDAVVITHVHTDHASHALGCSRAFGAPVYLTQPTAHGLDLPSDVEWRRYRPGVSFRVGPLDIFSYSVPHDVPQVALVVAQGDARFGIATDLGRVPPGLIRHLEGCGTVLLESNHDPKLLALSPYPPEVQQRIAGPRGHLSNRQAADAIAELSHSTEHVVLMHLSESSNSPALARAHAEEALKGRRTRLDVADPVAPLTFRVRPVPGQLALAL